ncbi:LptE family protein [bacterium]|nr:LptE family protein [bacterium]
MNLKPQINIYFLISFLGLSLFLIAGCGYSFYAGVAGLQAIAIKNLENKTYEHGLETLVAEAIRDEFIFDGSLKVVKEREADLGLSGSVIEYILEPLTYDEDDKAEGYRLKIRAKLTLKNLSKDETVWKDKIIEGDARYLLSGSLAGTESGARDEALKDLAKEILRQIIDTW